MDSFDDVAVCFYALTSTIDHMEGGASRDYVVAGVLSMLMDSEGGVRVLCANRDSWENILMAAVHVCVNSHHFEPVAVAEAKCLIKLYGSRASLCRGLIHDDTDADYVQPSE